MWRPEDWKKKHPNPCKDCKDKVRPGLADLTSAKFCQERCTRDDRYSAFEAGADAILVALKENRISVLSYKWVQDAVGWADRKKGMVVFIPEEE